MQIDRPSITIFVANQKEKSNWKWAKHGGEALLLVDPILWFNNSHHTNEPDFCSLFVY